MQEPKKAQEKSIIPDFIKENFIAIPFIFTLFVKLMDMNLQLGINFIFPRSYILILIAVVVSILIYAPVLFFKNKVKATLVISLLISLIFILDLVHYRYFDSLPSFESLALLREAGKVSGSALLLLKAKDILYFTDSIFLTLLILLKKIKPVASLQPLKKRILIGGIGLIIVLSTLGGILFIDRKNIKLFNASLMDKKILVERYTVIGSHFFSIYKSVSDQTVKISEEEKEQTISWLNENVVKKVAPNEYTGTAKGKNVIIIQMESLQNVVVGKKINGTEITPNLNNFLNEAHYFDNNFYEIGMGNTSDSDFQANTSLHPLTDAAAFVRYPKQDYKGLPRIMKESGYFTAAYHAYNRNFWNREVAFPKLGYDKYYAQESFAKGNQVIMGLNDQDFFNETAKYIKDNNQPSFSYVISLSSHYPFDMPPDYLDKGFEQKELPYRFYHYLQSIHYADKALGDFFEKLKKEGLYDDTLIVLYGDHLAKIADDPFDDIYTPLGLSRDSFKDELELKKTPLLIKMPGQKERKNYSKLTSTIDVMPTILNLIGYEKKYLSFGSDVFSKDGFYVSDHYFTYFSDNNYHYVWEEEQEICKQGKNYADKPVSECRDLIERAEKEKKFSANLIKYNLFKDLKW